MTAPPFRSRLVVRAALNLGRVGRLPAKQVAEILHGIDVILGR